MLTKRTGEVYAFGRAANGRLGLGEPKAEAKPEAKPANYQIKNLLDSLISDKPPRYRDATDSVVLDPTLLEDLLGDDRRAVQVSAGNRHSLVLTDDGIVWSFGFGGHFGLGRGSSNNSFVPLPIESKLIIVAGLPTVVKLDIRVVGVSAGHEVSTTATYSNSS
jgi:alpha-tubulin suppressor-like RCC1 family protein